MTWVVQSMSTEAIPSSPRAHEQATRAGLVLAVREAAVTLMLTILRGRCSQCRRMPTPHYKLNAPFAVHEAVAALLRCCNLMPLEAAAVPTLAAQQLDDMGVAVDVDRG